MSNTPRHVHPRALLLNSQHTESTMQNVYNDVAQIRLPIKRRPCLVIPIISSGVHNHSAIPCEDAHTHLSIETYKYTVYMYFTYIYKQNIQQNVFFYKAHGELVFVEFAKAKFPKTTFLSRFRGGSRDDSHGCVFFAPSLPLPRYHLGRTVPSFDPPFALANTAEVVMDEILMHC